MTVRPRVTTAGAVVVGIWIVLLPLVDVFDGWTWALQIAGGALVAAVVAVLVERHTEVPAVALVGITALGALVWDAAMVSGAFRRDPVSRDAWSELRHGVFEGWAALMDDQSPLRDPTAARIFVATLAWVTAAAAIHLTVRRASPLPAMAIAGSVLWITVAAALPSGAAPGILGALAGVAALVIVATLATTSDDHWGTRRFVSLTAMLVAAGGVATLAGQAAGTVRDDPIDPRSGRSTEVVDLEVPDILADYATLVRGDAEVLQVEPVASGTTLPRLRLRLQTYEEHDGTRWIPTSEYRPVAQFPSPDDLPPGDVVRLRIRPRRFDGPWVPLPDRLIDTDLEDFRWSAESGTALNDERLRAYEVTGTVVGRTGLEGVEADGEVDARYTATPPGLPVEITQAAQEAAADAEDAIGRVDAITTLVGAIGRDDSGPPGHTMARLRDVLDAGEPTGPEQLVSLHALMVRVLGIPSRIVVGYETAGGTVTADQLSLWTEVAFPGVGWVPIDPVPAAAESRPAQAPDQTSTTTSLPEDSVIEARALPRELGPGEDPDETEVTAARNYTWADVAIVVGALIVLGAAGLSGSRLLRRRIRRGDDDPQVRALGAWAELTDRLREAGAPITSVTTVDDVVFMAERMSPELGRVAARVGAVASEALHGPEGPTPAEAEAAWDDLRLAESALTEVRGRRVLLSRLLDPRVLRYRTPLPPPSRR